MPNTKTLRPLPPLPPATRAETLAALATHAAAIGTALFALVQAIV